MVPMIMMMLKASLWTGEVHQRIIVCFLLDPSLAEISDMIFVTNSFDKYPLLATICWLH